MAVPAQAQVHLPPTLPEPYSIGRLENGSLTQDVLHQIEQETASDLGDIGQVGGAAESIDPYSRLSAESVWRAGLAAWRAGDFEAASRQFETVATSGRASTWVTAGGAFWAARAHLLARHPAEVSHWLTAAADCTETFYGLLARRILGLPMPFNWDMSDDNAAALAAVNESPAGQRAIALIAGGDHDQAVPELRALAGQGRLDLAHGAMIVAENAGMAELAFRLQRVLRPYGIEFTPAAYPIPRWQPDGGFTTDRALVYALMRQESNFAPGAVSRAGARGVMQLMPATARYIARVAGLPLAAAGQLRRPEINMALGERYLEYLLADENVGRDLFRLAAAWNGGPGNLERWQQRDVDADNDPLLFIETIPAGETRAFIEHVMANFWIYRHRMGQPSPSLDALAAGRWPAYDGIAPNPVEIAEHESE